MANAEFEFSDQDFQQIRRVINQVAGISLADGKRELVYSRLSRRLRQLGLRRFEDYCELLESGNDPAELSEFVNALTTNLTSFFREPHHFDFLANELLPALVRARFRQPAHADLVGGLFDRRGTVFHRDGGAGNPAGDRLGCEDSWRLIWIPMCWRRPTGYV
jgi:hypothetical protein